MHVRFLAVAVAGAVASVAVPHDAIAASDGALRAKVVDAFARVRSYRLTVLGSARSLGIWVAPDRYQMTTEIGGGTPVRTVIVGTDYWTRSGGKWEHSGRVSNNLQVDIAGLIRDAKAHPSVPFARLADQTQDGKRVGTFTYAFKNGTDETCNYDLVTYRVTRCKADEVTILYAGYNDARNRVDAVPARK
ncbi:MAG: hypothetical protein NVS2B8_00610 [Vulcanimicrobiaceae bacterium]